MKVYLDGEKARLSPQHRVHCAPAADTGFTGSEQPDAWFNPDGSPKQIETVFEFGEADVPDELGRYMIARGIAKKSRLFTSAIERVLHA